MKPYNPSKNGPGLEVEHKAFGFNVVCSGLSMLVFPTPEHCVTMYANAIADDVHGAELADLRKRIADALAVAKELDNELEFHDPSSMRIIDHAASILAILKGPPA